MKIDSHTIQAAQDTAVGLGAISVAGLYNYVHFALKEFMLVGGAVLVAARLFLAWREWKCRRQSVCDD